VAVERPVGGRVSYRIAENPDRPRVVFVHGSPGSAAQSADYLRELSDVAGNLDADLERPRWYNESAR
jgi:hypothetical protein